MNNNPIGVFDSGVGGLSILLELKKLLPKETFLYMADQKFMPYGAKTAEELQERVDKIASFLVSQGVKAIVVACNTATIAAIETLRQKYEVPIIGTVPVIKTISSASTTKKIAVFSTPSTSKSSYLNDPIGFVTKFYGIGLGLIGLVGLLFLIIGGYHFLISRGDPEQIHVGKSYITYAIIGIFLAIFGFVFIQVIASDILKIPGFG
jgi:glutamate racemase